MSHFNFEHEINEATRLDAPMERGPLARWQRKALEAGVKALSLDAGLNLSGLSGPRSCSLKTPMTPLGTRILVEKLSGVRTPSLKTPGLSCRTPKTTKTPSRTPGKLKNKPFPSKTPNKSAPNTPHHGQDRFIPNRSAMDLESGHYKLTQGENSNPVEEEAAMDETNYTSKMTRALSENNLQDHKILSFTQKAPRAKEGYLNNLKVLYNGAPSAQKGVTVSRQIPQQPDRIMDAPDLTDDYYLNLLSWSPNNHLAVALGSAVYLWNGSTGTVEELAISEDPEEYISSLSFVKEGNFLAIGSSTGAVQLWDVCQQKLMRTMTGHAARVGVLSWNSYILSSGTRSGAIHNHDVRVAEHHVGTMNNHSQEVCGLSWSPDGRHLASGGNDNLINIWDNTMYHETQSVHTFTEHQAAVKALAWCPWQNHLLASGGGTADRFIRFWNVTTGSCVNSVDTNSQVCSILWSKDYKELISGHGFSQNQLTIWKYPALSRVTNLLGHKSRILCLAMSPDGSTVASAAADETIRLWKCFPVDKQSKVSKITTKVTSSMLMKGIR